MLFGSLGSVAGATRIFDDGALDDGVPQVGAATSRGAVPRVGIPGRGTVGDADRSLFRWTARADAVDVRLGAPVRYELDGGERPLVSRLKVGPAPRAVTVRGSGRSPGPA
jgi:diacylglycerol kinase (ATP)